MMNKAEFERKLQSLPTAEPDKLDLAMIKKASNINDDTSVGLDEYKEYLNYSGRLVIRIPKSLHCQLSEAAKLDGVSLNQYILYKLAK